MTKTPSETPKLTAAIAAAEELIDLEFTAAERELMLDTVAEHAAAYRQLRELSLPNDLPPALRFDPGPADEHPAHVLSAAAPAPDRAVEPPLLPADLDEIAFWPVSDLAQLVQTRQISSLALTEFYLDRLKRYDPLLECVVTLTEDLAVEQAQRADAELAAGRSRGPLHGIPWGAKDLLAARGYPTTWGATTHKDQVIDMDAAVVQKLEAAGAVLVAKLTLGALAWGDVWFGGKTRTPWNLEEGSSGSSAGPGAAVAAGLVGFAIGSETWGSIVSPSTQCGVSGLRPSFGRVSRHGAMALSWSMDKIGPMCRSVEDCALVFAAIHGGDGRDPSAITRPFSWPPAIELSRLRVGYLAAAFEQEYAGRAHDEQTLAVLRELGVDLIPIALPDLPVAALSIILSAEAAAAFDDLTRSGRDDLLVRQGADAWPNVFRAARLIPAVEYIQANRVRTLLTQAMHARMADLDAYVAPTFAGSDNLLLSNLTGHPAVVVPNGLGDNGVPTSITFTGRLFGESALLALADRYQQATSFHGRHPALPLAP